jgi:integrase
MGRKRTGSKFFRDGIWYIKLTVSLRGGGIDRRTIELPKGTTEDQAEAKRIALANKAATRMFDRREPIEATSAEIIFDDYVELWLKARIARGLRSVRKDRQRLRDHVTPQLRGKAMRDITQDDLRRVVAALDRKIHDPAALFAWTTAGKTWGAVTKLFRDAARSKDPALRVLRVNPCDGVEGPDRGHEKAKQWVYPREFAALIACEENPLRWRRIYAVATYLYLRLSEVRALDWSDLDLVHAMARIHRSTDERGRHVREHTKTGSVRLFRIEPALMPVLKAMALESGAVGRVFGSVANAPGELRAHLLRAGVSRAALHDATETSLALRFHDLRATGITWAAIRGDSPLEIRDRAGHAELEQTNEYMRRAAGAGEVGQPFPSLDPLFDSVPPIVPDPDPSEGDSHIDAAASVRRGGLEAPSGVPDDAKCGENVGGTDANAHEATSRDNSGDDSEPPSTGALRVLAERLRAAADLLDSGNAESARSLVDGVLAQLRPPEQTSPGTVGTVDTAPITIGSVSEPTAGPRPPAGNEEERHG